MSHPVFTPGPTFEVPKPDCPLDSSGSFNFSAGSSYAAGFSKTCTEKPHISSRSRPRLTKVRRRQTVKTDLGMNGVSDVGGEKDGNLGNVAGDNSQNSGPNRSADLNGNMEQLGSGLVFGGSLNDPLFGSGSGNGKPLFSSQLKEKDCSFTFNKVSPNFDVHKETGSFVFGAHKDGPVMKQNLPGDANSGSVQFVFGAGEKDSGGNFGQPKVSEFQKPNNTQFVFGSDSNGVNVDKSEGDKVFGSTIPDMRGKAEKVCDSCFQFPCNCNKYHGNCKFGIDLENKSTGKVRYMPDFRDSGKENVGVSSENTGLNGVFVFGGLEGKGSLKSCGGSKPFSEMNQLKRGKAYDCNGFGQHNQNSGSDINSKFQDSASLGDSFETGPVFDILNKMSRLNIGDSEADAKKFFSGNSLDTDNVFVFRGVQKTSDFIEDCHPNKSQKTPDVRQSDRTSSSFLPSAGVGVMGNDGFCEVLFMNKDEKDSSFRCKLDGLDSSNADGSTPNMKFDFSKNNLFPCIDKLDNANLRSLGSKKSKKKNGKLRQRTVVQQLFSQNHVSKEGNPEQIQKSPGCGSPMDFSPYRDTSARNAPDSNTETGVKGELPGSEKNTSAHCEKPHDDRSTSSFPPLPAQDGLTNIRLQYKKKYKLKVGSNPTTQRNSPDKENAKQEPSGATTLEVCEHWRIRGNEAYHAGQHSKAEEFYSMGIKSVQHVNVLEYSIKPLLLCYSNRAATRMSLGRMREAIGDCTKASELDPNFLRATLRAGNCYLVLGEVDDAIECYTKCSSDGTSICLDRKVTIEAADGLQKAKKVAEHILQCAKILKEGTEDAAKRALGIIEEALSISRYSERLLEMKGEALHMLRMYDEVIQLCERTLDIAEKNFSADRLYNPKCKTSHVKLWRWHLQTKSYYRLGKLELALDLIEKQEKMPISSMSGDVTQESSVFLAANIRELISLKKSGNEAFISGKDTEATEHYTAAISKSFESRGFMAICFCNRAAAYQSLGQFVDAISDCSVAIALDENYTKAISRRATLHELIRDYKQAVCDLERVVSLLESQSQTKTQGKSSGGGSRELRKARHRLSSAEEKAKKETPLDLYLILGIKASDSESEIKKAYRKAALRHHPDKAGQVLARNDVADDGTLRKEFGEKIHNDADRLFKIIGEAYAVLSDPSKRSKYDDEEEMRKIYRESARNSNSGHPSTSYSSPFERGSSSGRQSGSYERRRYWHDAKSYSYSHSRW